jgi:cobalt/nickel transport system permease protein
VSGRVAGSVETVSSALRGVFVAEDVAARGGFLQRRDPRVVVLALFALALATMLSRTPAVLVALGGLTVVLARRSSVPLRRLLARSSVVPLVSALAVLPQAVLMPGDVLVELPLVAVTTAGAAYVATFTLRVGVGVALLSLLVLTTPFSAVVAAMDDLGVPTALVWVVAVTYRYLFLFFDELRRLVLARNSRTTGDGGVRSGWRDARNLAGTFLLRTLDRGERVGRGMRARGGARAPAPYRRHRSVDRRDWLLAATALAALAVSVVVRWTP